MKDGVSEGVDVSEGVPVCVVVKEGVSEGVDVSEGVPVWLAVKDGVCEGVLDGVCVCDDVDV